MYKWQEDMTYYWVDESGEFRESPRLSGVPESCEEYGRICDAVSFFPRLSLRGKSAHVVSSQEHALYLHIIDRAIEKHGEMIEIYRGHRGEWAMAAHKILYGTTIESVASHYGPVVDRMTVIGLVTESPTKSVLSEDLDTFDIEVIFKPNGVVKNA